MLLSDAFEVEGGVKLSGNLVPQGAKNEALQVLCASVLTSEPVTYSNIPRILDVERLINLLSLLGVKTEWKSEDTLTLQADNLDMDYLNDPKFIADAQKIRGSIMLVGALLARYKKAFLPKPGGDKIGRRRIDTHLLALEKLGASFRYDEARATFSVSTGQLTGNYILLDEISVTGTANIVLAAVMARGKTTIYNAACEPYVQQLCRMLTRMGANIRGIGSNLLEIEGVDQLGGTHHRLLPDMIEIGSFITMAAVTGSEIVIRDAAVNELGNILPVFRKVGLTLNISGDDIHVPPHDIYEIDTFLDGSVLSVYDAPWPGFTPDLISVLIVLASQARGSMLIHQKMFESRLFFVDKLIDMGAQIILCDPHRATVIGSARKQKLRAITMTSPDIRAGVALLIAAMAAEGTSMIHNINQIDRGYQHIEQRLNALGARIKRISYDS